MVAGVCIRPGFESAERQAQADEQLIAKSTLGKSDAQTLDLSFQLVEFDDGSYVQRYPIDTMRSAPNVAGILEGSDPLLKEEYVVFSAHMDHIGIGPPNAEGDSINNGADDDASGTTAVLEIAEAYASLARKPKRSAGQRL